MTKEYLAECKADVHRAIGSIALEAIIFTTCTGADPVHAVEGLDGAAEINAKILQSRGAA